MPRHVSLVAAAAQQLLISYPNTQMGDGEMLVKQEYFSSCKLGQAAAGGLLGSVAGAPNTLPCNAWVSSVAF